MNCKPGDLAIVVRADYPPDEFLLGRIVRVTHVVGVGGTGLPIWAYEGARICHPVYGEFEGIADEDMRPIRDSDGKDETLTWAGLPHKEHA